MEIVFSELSDRLATELLSLLEKLDGWGSVLVVKEGLPLFFVKHDQEPYSSLASIDVANGEHYTLAMLTSSLLQVSLELIHSQSRVENSGGSSDDSLVQHDQLGEQHSLEKEDLVTLLKGLKNTKGSKPTELVIYGSKNPEFTVIITYPSQRFVLDPKSVLGKYMSFFHVLKGKIDQEGSSMEESISK